MALLTIINSTYEYLKPGGAIMIFLIINSLLMWTLIMEKVFYFSNLISKDIDIEEAVLSFCNKKTPEKVTGIKSKIVQTFLHKQDHREETDSGRLNILTDIERSRVRRNLSLIAVLAGISPLLGLLGTVTGMITTFDVISFFGTGNAKAMAGGISQALITTQSGLLIAIPGFIMSSFLYYRARNINNHLEEFLSALRRHM